MPFDQTTMPTLYSHAETLRQEIVMLSGLTADTMDEISSEIGLHYEMFLYEYRGPELADPFVHICQMLTDWPTPWSYLAESDLNGLTLAQFYLAWAYHENGMLLFKPDICLKTSAAYTPMSADGAAFTAISATKAVMRAKQLMGTAQNCIAQEANTAQLT